MYGSHKRVGPEDLVDCGGDDCVHGVHLKGGLLVVAVGLVVQADALGARFREDEAVLAPGPGRARRVHLDHQLLLMYDYYDVNVIAGICKGNRKARRGGEGRQVHLEQYVNIIAGVESCFMKRLSWMNTDYWSMIQNKPISRWIYQILCYDKENCKARGGWESNYQHVASQPFVLRPNKI